MHRSGRFSFSTVLVTLTTCIMASQAMPTGKAQSRYVTTQPGIRIHYLEAGSSTSLPALILIPGWRMPAFLWNEQIQGFSKITRVIAIDPRSQGVSTKTRDGNTPESRAVDLHGLLRELQVHKCVLVGWS